MAGNSRYERALKAYQTAQYENAQHLLAPLVQAKRPDIQVLDLAGAVEVNLGNLDMALALYRKLVQRESRRASHWAGLGYVAFGVGRYEEAGNAYANAAELNPQDCTHGYYAGLSCVNLCNYAEAAMWFQRVLARKPGHAGAMWALANVRREQGRVFEAMPLMQAVLEQPSQIDPATWLDYAEAAMGTLDVPEVRRAISHVDLERSNDADTLARAAQVLSRLGDVNQSRQAMDRALSLQPRNPEILNDAATIENDAGEFEKAEALYRKIIELRPGMAKAYFGLSQLHTFDRESPEDRLLIDVMEGLSDDEVDDPPFIHFSLGKIYADLGQFDESFRHLSIANGMRRLQRPYDRERDRQRVDFCREHFSPGSELLESGMQAPKGSVSPIFVVGMPRSGTTLVEQMIGSHPDVTPLGELMLMPYLVEDMYRDVSGPPSVDALADVATIYRERVGHLANNNTRVVDKLPHNIFNVGEIASSMPDAKIICMHRDGGDVGLSCFATPFQQGIDYASDLADIGFMIRVSDSLSRMWCAALPARVITVAYEDVVQNPQEQMRQILAFCDLPWSENILKFNEYRRRVGTASFVQVSKPLYRTSVAKWRHYVGHLAPLMNALNQC